MAHPILVPVGGVLAFVAIVAWNWPQERLWSLTREERERKRMMREEAAEEEAPGSGNADRDGPSGDTGAGR
jgi:hypothetical protein